MAKCRIGTANFFTLLLLLYRTSVNIAGWIPKASSAYALTANSDLAEQRQQYVLQQMEEYGYRDGQGADTILQNGQCCRRFSGGGEQHGEDYCHPGHRPGRQCIQSCNGCAEEQGSGSGQRRRPGLLCRRDKSRTRYTILSALVVYKYDPATFQSPLSV